MNPPIIMLQGISDPGHPTTLSADQISAYTSVTAGKVVELTGKVQAISEQQAIQADRARYDRSSQNLEVRGRLIFETPDMQILGNQGQFNLGTHLGAITAGQYRFMQSPGHGTAQSTQIMPGNTLVLKQGNYTTCPMGQDDWQLRFSRLTIDKTEGIGYGRNVWLSFMDVPFLYAPYLTFPIDDRRRSGLLTPSYRYSTNNGSELAIPIYLNLAPNYDLTLQPRNMTLRGQLIGGEFRYLLQHGTGSLTIEYLPNDYLRKRTRNRVKWKHHSQLTPKLQADVDIQRVSDTHYLEELGNSLSTASISHLPQKISLRFSGDRWQGQAQIQAYQTVDVSIPEAARPYQMLPSIDVSSRSPLRKNRLNLSITGQYINFQRTGRVSGGRLRLRPKVSLPLRSTAAQLNSNLSWDHTRYQLNAQNTSSLVTSSKNTFGRTLPEFNLDGRLFLERDINWQHKTLRQTLEPRLFYLYRPFRDQNELPIFDAGTIDLSYAQLFAENRFNGGDRLGDSNQLTMAISSAVLDMRSGQEWARMEIGQIYYFQNRRVTLPGTRTNTSRTSDITANARIRLPSKVSLNTDMRWDPVIDRFDKANLSLQFNPGKRQVINLSYRYRWKTQAQTDLSLLWPITKNLHLLGRWNRSTRNNRDLETLIGLEYDSCCWKFQILRRRYVNNASLLSSNEVNTNKSWFFQLTLKGLTRIGNQIDSVLESGILGYRKY